MQFVRVFRIDEKGKSIFIPPDIIVQDESKLEISFSKALSRIDDLRKEGKFIKAFFYELWDNNKLLTRFDGLVMKKNANRSD